MIKLQIKETLELREFEKTHALSILRLKNCAFELPQDSQFEFINNEFRAKPDKAIDIEAPNKGNSKTGSKPRKQA